MDDATSFSSASASPAARSIDTSFTLDPALLEERRSDNARRIHALQLPLVRCAGFAVVSAIAILHDLNAGRALDNPALLILLGINLAYCAGSWLALWLGYGRSGRLDLSLLFFHTDVLVWLVALHHIESSTLIFAFLLLVRVADQVGFGFRRALYFCHVVAGIYLAYSAALWLSDADARWPERLAIGLMMYLIGAYLALTGLVIERLRNRTREAVRAARQLVDRLEHDRHALEQARLQAVQASVAKSQFLATISHEIRTPMNGIMGATELLLGMNLNELQHRFAETAHRSSSALLAIIDDMLDLARIEAGKLAIKPRPFDLPALLHEVVDLLSASARDKALDLRCELPPDLPRLVGDPVRLRQILLNLLGNAVKFTHRGGVTLRVTVPDPAEGPLRLHFEVSDTGIGIPGEQLPHIFDRFTQVDASTTRRYGGSGLGLAIVKELVQLMQGELGVTSEPGAGSAFWFVLPMAPAPETPAPAPAAAAPRPAPVGRVLLAEDNDVNQLILQSMLLELGCTVDMAHDGAAACRAVGERAYDLVFMDCHMPGMDGFEATRRIRAQEAGGDRRTPIVALTAAALPDDRAACLAAGMDDFLSKPVDLAELRAAMARWIEPAGYDATVLMARPDGG